MIEIFKHEESGHGDILSQEFLQWRSHEAARSAAKEPAAAKSAKLAAELMKPL